MAYTSKALMIARWGTDEVARSADRDPQDGVSEDEAIAAACEDASSLVDSYLVKAGIVVPVDPAPAVLVMHATNVAMYELSQGVGAAYTEEKRKRFEDAISWLKTMASGSGALPGIEPANKPTRRVRAGGFPLAYTAEKLRGTGGLL